MKLGIGRWLRVAVAFAPLAVFTACPPSAQSPHDQAASAVTKIATGVHVADVTCASTARIVGGAKGEAIAVACAKGYVQARHGLIAAASAVDVWGTVEATHAYQCGAAEVVAGLQAVSESIIAAGVSLPSEIAIALETAQVPALMVASGAQCTVASDAGVDAPAGG